MVRRPGWKKVRPAQHKSGKSSTPVLTVDDTERAEKCIWSQVQLESLPKEVLSLSSDNVFPSNSQLAPLVPFLNTDLIRARGRLRKASCLSFEQKHPVILSSKHVVVKLFFNDVHISNAHEGVEYFRSLVQQMFGVLGLRSETPSNWFEMCLLYKTCSNDIRSNDVWFTLGKTWVRQCSLRFYWNWFFWTFRGKNC